MKRDGFKDVSEFMKEHTNHMLDPSTLRADNPSHFYRPDGWNPTSIRSRIAMMKHCIRIGWVEPECVGRALRTIDNLEAQLKKMRGE